MILENYRQTADYESQTIKETAKQNSHSYKGEREFLTPRNTVKMRPLKNISQFASPNRFDALRMTANDNKKESDEQLIQNETDLHLLKSIISKTKSRASTTVILGDLIVKKKRLWQCYYEINKKEGTCCGKAALRHRNRGYKTLCKTHGKKNILHK